MGKNSIYPRHNNFRTSKLFFALLILAIMGLAAATGTHLYYFKTTQPEAATSHSVTAKAASNNLTKLEGSYLFSGTIVLARGVESYANGDYNQPFSGMASLGTYDAHIGVLECPITTNADSFANEVQNLVFNCQPYWLPYLKKYFPILNLSSDHLNDQGPQGIASTFKLLNAAGFQTVGTYDPHSLSDDCKAIILPVRIIASNGQTKPATLPIAMCSYNYKFLFQPQPGEIASISQWSKIMPVIALLNEGPEYHHTASTQQVEYAHEMIDAGADMVIGNGTHWIQNTEIYKGKLIAYSMGNFIFDQLDKDGRIALNLAVNISLPYSPNLARWINLAPTCLANNESCYKIAESMHLTKLKPFYSFNAIASYGGYLQVATKASPADQAYMEMRANWTQTLSQLPHNY